MNTLAEVIARIAVSENTGWDSTLVRNYVEKELRHMEKSLDDVEAPLMEVPAPMTAHPSLEYVAGVIRSAATSSSTILIPVENRSVGFVDGGAPEPTSNLMFDRRKCAAPMPYVGEPDEVLVYVWSVWFDSYGRHVACDTEIQKATRPQPKN